MALFDLARARRETPGCANVLHFNNAGASLMPDPVIEAVLNHLHLESRMGGYEAYEHSLQAIEHFYDAAARLLGCDRDEIAFTENATRAWDMAFYSLKFQPGDRILTARTEYSSNFIAFLQVATRTGAIVEAVPSDEYGRVSTEALRDTIDERVRLIAITHVPTNGGLVNPACEIGKIAKETGIPYLLDACQSAGQMPVDVREIGCDMLSATGRKYLRGPRATGLLFVSRKLIGQLEPVFLDMHAAKWVAPNRYEVRSDARRFENWEQNYAGKVGLAVAIDYALEWGLEIIRDRIFRLAQQLRNTLSEISAVTVRDLGREKCGIVTFTANGKEPETLKSELAARKIHVTVSPQSSTLLDMQDRGLTKVVRASVHYYNSEDEIDRFCATLKTLL